MNVENEVGQIEVLVNNAGITRDGMLHRMTHEQCSLCIAVAWVWRWRSNAESA